jgi:uroporphyrinogen-III synthase
MNAQAYFSHHARLPGQKIVAIGATTAEALARLGFSDVLIAAEPNERSLAKSTIKSGI